MMYVLAVTSFLAVGGAQPQVDPALSSVISMAKTLSADPTSSGTPGAGGSFLGGGGSCASPTAIPPGPTLVNFPFDLTMPASMGVATNPFEFICSHSGLTGIDNEEWWSWTATADGLARLRTCSNLSGVDTKIAIYADDCPNMDFLDPISCKDDDPTCPSFETTVVWEITNGENYLIQLGTFVSAPGGAADFSIEQLPALPAGQYDLGVSQNAYGANTAGGDILWMQVFDAGAGQDVVSVSVAFSTGAAPENLDGDAATIVVYAGDPVGGLTRLTTELATISAYGTDTAVNYPLAAPVSVSGLYTVGVLVNLVGLAFPAGIDLTINSRGRAFLALAPATGPPIDLDDTGSAALPPTEMQSLGGNNDGVFLLRVHTTPSLFMYPSACNGDGGDLQGCTECPCMNNASAGTTGGCLNSAGTSARLVASGDPSVSLGAAVNTDLRFGLFGGPANAFSILISADDVAPVRVQNPCMGQGSGSQRLAFDGLSCAVTNMRRHGGRQMDSNGSVGVVSDPWGGEGAPAAGLAQALGGFISGQTRYFQAIYRDDAQLGCMRGLNTSQAIEVAFQP